MPVLLLTAAALVCGGLSGCAAMTDPVANGLPVRRLPSELLAAPKGIEQTIPLTLLGQKQPDVYRLAPGDVLGVFIDGVLGDRTQPLGLQVAPLVQVREQRRLPPTAGYPIPVRQDGTIVLPLAEPVLVQGMSLSQVEEALRKLYVNKQVLRQGNERVVVTLLHARTYHVVVLRQEAANFTPGPEGLTSASKRGTGHQVELFAYENDVLHALTLSGGLPGLDAFNDVIIQRGSVRDQACPATQPGDHTAIGICPQAIRIPLRLPPGAPLPFRPEDVVLQDGDVVFIEARDNQLFYTGGLLPPGEHVLPRDRDLDVVEAVAQVRGPLVNGAFGGSNLAGNLISPGIGGPSPSLLIVLRWTPGGGQVPIRIDLNRALRNPHERILVKAGDMLILQEKPEEALARYFTQTFLNFNLVWQVVHERFATGVVDVSAPDRLPNRLGTTVLSNQ